MLVGLIFGLDLLWALVVGSAGTIAYALVDEPGHLATCALALLVLSALLASPLPHRFTAAALAFSVAIDLDHLPRYLGSGVLTGDLPRPYTHSLIPIAALIAVGLASRRSAARQISLGAAFGIASHLLRDLATGPGIPLLWPLSDGVVRAPYAVFAGAVSLMALILLATRAGGARRALQWAAAAALLFVLLGFHRPEAVRAATPPRVALGAYIPYSGEDPSLIEAYGAQVGQRPVLVSSYRDWTKPLLDPTQLDAAWERGGVPLVTWEPWSQHDEGETFPMAAIAAGCCDEFIAESAQQAAAWGRPLFLRFAHEMNGGWYPWGRGRPGSSPGAYKAAWRHVVSIFRANGATNVKWVWTPYVTVGHRFRFAQYFPGDRWVDWAGVDGLNGGPVFGWRSFESIFRDSYTRLVRLTRRPLILAEVGSSEDGGDKAAWLARALSASIPKMTHIRAIVWWADGSDYRGNFAVDSSPAALSALRRATARSEYHSDRQRLLGTPRHLARPARPARNRKHRRGSRQSP